MVVKRVSRKTPASEQLSVFIRGLGEYSAPSIYKYNNQLYIDSGSLMSILSVKSKDFKKHTESPLHHIDVNGTLCVSKYGITVMLSMSREAIAFRLQDYLFELFYRVETTGNVSREDCETREALLAELSTYQLADQQRAGVIDRQRDEIMQLSDSAAYWKEQAEKYRTLHAECSVQCDIYTSQIAQYQSSHATMCKWLKKMPNPPECTRDFSDDESEITYRDVIRAKKEFEGCEKKFRTLYTKGKPTIATSTVWLMRDGAFPEYHWSLTTNAPSEAVMARSELVLMGEVDDAESIVYATLHCSGEEIRAIKLFLKLTNGYSDEATIAALIE